MGKWLPQNKNKKRTRSSLRSSHFRREQPNVLNIHLHHLPLFVAAAKKEKNTPKSKRLSIAFAYTVDEPNKAEQQSYFIFKEKKERWLFN